MERAIMRSCHNDVIDQDQDNKRVSDDISMTFCGSTAYAAPEILQGHPYTDFMSDVWSLGVILYIMLTGVMPYDDNNVRRMIERQNSHIIRYHITVAHKGQTSSRGHSHPNQALYFSESRLPKFDKGHHASEAKSQSEIRRDNQLPVAQRYFLGDERRRRGRVRPTVCLSTAKTAPSFFRNKQTATVLGSEETLRVLEERLRRASSEEEQSTES